MVPYITPRRWSVPPASLQGRLYSTERVHCMCRVIQASLDMVWKVTPTGYQIPDFGKTNRKTGGNSVSELFGWLSC